MKILVVTQYYYPENFSINSITKTLVAFGHEVTVLTGKPNYGYGKILEGYSKVTDEIIDGVSVHRVSLYPRKNSRISIIRNYLSFWRNSRKWARKTKQKFDVVYSMSLSPVISVSAANLYSKKHNVPHLLHCVDLWPESTVVTKNVQNNGFLYHILLNWSKKIYRGATRVIVGSPSFADYFSNVLKLTKSVSEYVPQPSLVAECNTEPVTYNGGFNIVYCGNIGRLQLVDMIIKSASLLGEKSDVRFHVIGMGSEKERFEKLLHDSGVNNYVTYYGPIPAAKSAAYFLNADALYLSLKNEGVVGKTIPNKLIMYMAFGKPIIGVVGGDAQALLRNSGGAVFAQENPESVCEAILALEKMDVKDRQKIGLLNKKYFESHFTIETITRRIESHLLDLMK